MVKLDILSDPVCPWCLIGKAELDRALEARPDHPFVIEWHPFQLNPDMPAGGMDRQDYLQLKFGDAGLLRAYQPIVDRIEALGLDADLGGIARQPNTLNAHRLIHWAGLEGRQTAAVAAVFRAFFSEGKDIGDIDTLIGIGAGIGLDAEMLRRLFATDTDAEAIAQRDRHARARGVGGVPCFIIANRHVLQGAQPAETWMQVIDEITEQLRAQPEDEA